MLEHDHAASRGEMALHGLYVFSRSDKFGNAPAHELFETIRITPSDQQPTRSFADYKIEIPDNADLPDG